MSENVRSHRDLIVWQKAVDLAVLIYDLVKTFPPNERYGFTSQLTRAATAVSANIAEGNARGSRREYAHFVGIARGSLMEVDSYLTIATRIGYITDQQAQPLFDLITEISKMLRALRNRLLEQ